MDVMDAPLKIRYKGVFDFEGVYKYVHDWIVRYGYRFHEKNYKDKLDTALGSETEVEIWGEKEVTEYYRHKIAVSFHTWETKDVMVTENGKQVKRSRGRIEIKINGSLVTDWQGKYKGSSVKKYMEKFMNDVVLKYDILIKHFTPMDEDFHKLGNEIGKLLKIESVL